MCLVMLSAKQGVSRPKYVFVISLFVPPNIALVGAKSIWEKYGTKWLIQRLKWIKDKIEGHKICPI